MILRNGSTGDVRCSIGIIHRKGIKKVECLSKILQIKRLLINYQYDIMITEGGRKRQVDREFCKPGILGCSGISGRVEQYIRISKNA